MARAGALPRFDAFGAWCARLESGRKRPEPRRSRSRRRGNVSAIALTPPFLCQRHRRLVSGQLGTHSLRAATGAVAARFYPRSSPPSRTTRSCCVPSSSSSRSEAELRRRTSCRVAMRLGSDSGAFAGRCSWFSEPTMRRRGGRSSRPAGRTSLSSLRCHGSTAGPVSGSYRLPSVATSAPSSRAIGEHARRVTSPFSPWATWTECRRRHEGRRLGSSRRRRSTSTRARSTDFHP